jgi:hypothetical protein
MDLVQPLNTEKGQIIVMEMLHHMYFAPLKSYLIVLLRSVLHLQKYACYLLQNKQTPWSESASELYRPSDRRLSAK